MLSLNRSPPPGSTARFHVSEHEGASFNFEFTHNDAGIKEYAMLGSWFSQKASDEGTIDGTTPRPSLASPGEPQSPPRQSTDKPSKRAFPTAFSTPHDTILSELQGTSSSRLNPSDVPHRPASCRSEQVVSPDFPEFVRDQVQNPTRSEGNLLAPTSTTAFPTTSRSSAPASSDLLLDPFDGMSLGVLIPRHGSTDNDGEISPSPFNLPSTFDGPANTSSVGNEAVWNHLSRILDLQSQISKKHLEMENIGTAKGNDTKRKGHKLGSKSVAEPSKPSSGLGLEDPSVPPGLHGPRRRVMSTVSAVSSSDEQDHEEGVNVPSEEAEKAQIREDEFAKLASQFEGRKEAINDIMSKLDDLSKALSQFHDLPSPNIEFSASRQNSAGVASPPLGTTSPPGPLKGDSKTSRPLSQNTSPDLNQAYDWSKQNAAFSSTVQPPAATVGREKNGSITVDPAPQKSISQKRMVPTVLVNSKEPQASIHDSPASIGSLKLA